MCVCVRVCVRECVSDLQARRRPRRHADAVSTQSSGTSSDTYFARALCCHASSVRLLLDLAPALRLVAQRLRLPRGLDDRLRLELGVRRRVPTVRRSVRALTSLTLTSLALAGLGRNTARQQLQGRDSHDHAAHYSNRTLAVRPRKRRHGHAVRANLGHGAQELVLFCLSTLALTLALPLALLDRASGSALR